MCGRWRGRMFRAIAMECAPPYHQVTLGRNSCAVHEEFVIPSQRFMRAGVLRRDRVRKTAKRGRALQVRLRGQRHPNVGAAWR
jgi:hypothetical protein